MIEILGEDNTKDGDGLKPFTPKAPILIPERKPEPQKIVNIPHGYYVIAYKKSDEDKGKNHFAVTEHTNIDKFIEDKLNFGIRTHDIKIIEKAENYLDALSIAEILTLEENFEGGYKRFRLGGMALAKYTFMEMFSKNTKTKRYNI